MYTSTFQKTITHFNQGNSSKGVSFSSGQTINLEGDTKITCAFSVPQGEDIGKAIATTYSDDKFLSVKASNANGSIVVQNDAHDNELFRLDSTNQYAIIFYYDTGAGQQKSTDSRYGYFTESALYFSGINNTSTPTVVLEILKNS